MLNVEFPFEEGLSFGKMVGQVDYMGAGDVVNEHPGNTNVVSSGIRISVHEAVFENSLTEKGARPIVQAKQKIVALMEVPRAKALKPGELVLHAFCRVLSRVKADILLYERKTSWDVIRKVVS